MRRWITAVLTAFALLGVVLVPVASPAAEAADARFFQPGNIISDFNFHDSSALSVDAVQRYLNNLGANCTQTSPACLKNFRMNTSTRAAESGLCNQYTGQRNQSAAQIIVGVAKACGISPKVLIVLIQKEQGLVTTTRPTNYMYNYTTGWCVTDSGSCVGSQVGFSNQLFMGARQFKLYERYPSSYRYRAGETPYVQYHPNTSCGGVKVKIQNQATANLYNYTPYVPNTAALNNLYGVGDSCSAYGNRNFWRIYSDWFGSPTGGDNLADWNGETVFLISGGVKYKLTGAPTLHALRPLGTVTRLSKAYLDSFPLEGTLTPAVRNSVTNEYLLLDNGKKYSFPDCNGAHTYKFSCGATVALTPQQLALFSSAGKVPNLVRSSTGTVYYIAGGVRREFYSTASLERQVGALSDRVTLDETTIRHIPVGAPMIGDGAEVRNPAGDRVVFGLGGTLWEVDAALYDASSMNEKFGVPKALTQKSFDLLDATPIDGFVRNTGTGIVHMLTATGTARLDGADLGAVPAADVPAALITALGPVDAVGARFVFSPDTSRNVYLFANGQKWRIRTTQERLDVAARLGIRAESRVVPGPVAALIPDAPAALTPGSVARSATGEAWLVDGVSHVRPIPAGLVGEFSAAPKSATPEQVADAASMGAASSMGMHCGSSYYIQNSGTLHPVRKATAQEYKPAFPFADYGTSTCDRMKRTSTVLGQFVRSRTGSIYYVQDGTKRRITSGQYTKMRGDGPPHQLVSNAFLNALPTA